MACLGEHYKAIKTIGLILQELLNNKLLYETNIEITKKNCFIQTVKGDRRISNNYSLRTNTIRPYKVLYKQ